MGIGPHDVPEDGTIAYRDHGLGANLCFLAQPSTQSAAENENGNIREFMVIDLPRIAGLVPDQSVAVSALGIPATLLKS